jgi:prephenate dehydrogenase
MNQFTIGFIGFGLIGGSIARVRRRLHKEETIIAYNYRAPSPNPNLEEALADGVLSRIETCLETFSECDIIFLCAPVLTNISYLEKLKPIIKPGCILTDVGSVKGSIHNAVKELGLEKQFVGGHPMAGTEKTSYHHSSDTLMKNAYYILTPTDKVPYYMTTLLTRLVEELDAMPVIMEPKEHDEAVAVISHIPHVGAAALVNLVRTQEHSDLLRQLSAGGFKDITRVASSSSEMWQNICLSNKDCILKFLKQLQGNLDEMILMLEREDKEGIYNFFAEAKKFRDSVPDKKGREKVGVDCFLEMD